MIWVELAVVIGCILIGSRRGGIAFGTVASIGLIILVFVFGLPPGNPPSVVLGMILTIITAAATMQAAGGLDYLVTVADRALRVWPAGITFVAPVVTYVATFAAGTGHIVYALLPVIAEVSRKAGVRPERPLSIATIASQQAITASPISAATVALLGMLSGSGITLQQILLVCVPSTFIGSMIGALAVSRIGPELKDDPEYRRRLDSGVTQPSTEFPQLTGQALFRARTSVTIFLVAALLVVLLGLFPSLRPHYSVLKEGMATVEQVDMAPAIMMIMLAAAGLNTLLAGASPDATVKGSLMTAGVIALISIAGLAWLGSSFFEGNRQLIVETISTMVRGHTWVFALGLFALSILLSSQAATVTTLVPVGLALGLSASSLVAMFPAVNGYFFLPTYSTILAAISFDQTGTTKVGKYLLDHSFMLPGLVSTVSALLIGTLLSRLFL